MYELDSVSLRFIMKKLIVLLLSLFRSKKLQTENADDKMWEHLDGAEFFVVPPQSRAAAPVE